MKADWTNADPVITKTLQQFGRVGVPLYVLYPASLRTEPIVLPELLTQSLVLDHLESTAPKVAAANKFMKTKLLLTALTAARSGSLFAAEAPKVGAPAPGFSLHRFARAKRIR